MPIFRDDFGGGRGTPPGNSTTSTQSRSPVDGNTLTRKYSEESIRTELCEGLVLEPPEEMRAHSDGILDDKFKFPTVGISDRVELIERLKKGETPTWLPNRNYQSLLHEYDNFPRKVSPDPLDVSPLLPNPPELEGPTPQELEQSQAGLQIERPRSALHSGDFTEGVDTDTSVSDVHLRSALTPYRLDEPPWHSLSSPGDFSPFQLDTKFPSVDKLDQSCEPQSRAPSLSSSYASSFILKPPTSPLVQSESNEDPEFSPQINPIDISPGFQRNPRRHTLEASHSVHSTPSVPTASNFSRPLPHLRRDNTYPYQAHQPRRSLTSNPLSQSVSSPVTPGWLRPRRPSFGSDSSPLHHASMVGSYEESILRGRMSTTPSKPLDFVAQIGVLGLAVFYSYETTSHGRSGKSEEGPSPYVGQIDIENTLQSPDETLDNKRKRHSANVGQAQAENIDMIDGTTTNQLTGRELRRAEKQKRRSTSPRAPLGGSYRIPEKGQLQIIIKNPNKTAVKLFLVPYDLAGMEPGTKTFIRQRSYSAGPIIDTALSSAQQTPSSNPLDRPTLRYLIHLHICSPSRSRFYLYKSIRVVFANRVPDGKEKLQNEISLPDPRFSVYKPGRDSSLGVSTFSGAGASLAAEKAYRRRSSGFALGPSKRMDGIAKGLETVFTDSPAYSNGRSIRNTPIQPIPFSFARKPARTEFEDEAGLERDSNIQSPTSSKSSRPTTSQESDRSMSWNSNSEAIGGYDKLSKGDIGYGGNVFAGPSDGGQVAEGLLAKKLRDLGARMYISQANMDGS